MPIDRINPDGMYKPNKNLYTQVVTSTGSKTIHIAGTVPFYKDGNVYGIDDVMPYIIYTVDVDIFVKRDSTRNVYGFNSG